MPDCMKLILPPVKDGVNTVS